MPQRSRFKGNKPTFDAEAAGAFLCSEGLRLELSQRDVAARAKVGKQTVVNIEHGHGSVTVKKLEAVAHALDLDLPTLVNKCVRYPERRLYYRINLAALRSWLVNHG